MFFTIVRKEFLSNVFSFRFTITMILCILLMLISSYTLREKYERQLSEYDAAVLSHRKALNESVNLQNVMVGGYILDKRPSPLSVVAAGLEGMGKTVTANIVSEPSLENSETNTEPLTGLFGTLDFAFITRIVISLLALLFTYDAIAGEREQGTLKLMLSNAVPRDLVILGKAFGSFVSLLLPLVISVLIGLIVIVLSPQVHFDGESWQRILLTGLISLLYVWVFTAVGLFVSARTERSATSLLSLLLIWVFFVLAVPKASNLLANQIYRVPSVQEIQGQKSAIEQQISAELLPKMGKVQQDSIEEVRKKWETSGRDIGKNQEVFRKEITDLIMQGIAELQKESMDRTNMERDKIQSVYERKLHSQVSLAMNLSRVSPASSYTFAMTSLANTGIQRQRTFLQDAKNYQRQFASYLNLKLGEGKGLGLNPDDPNDKLDLSDVPQFRTAMPSLETSLSEVWVDILLLVGLGVVFFMAAYVSFLRYDVR